MEGSPLLAEKQLAFASRCGSLSSSMQNSNALSCPTITYEEALRRELEYRKRLEITHPHLLNAANGVPVLPKEISTESTPDVLKRKSAPESSVPSPQASFSFATVRCQPPNWYPSKKKVKVQQPPSQAIQMPRPNSVPSFWCKICKVDCVTEFNFNAHIGGKKHKAKKIEILGNRNTGRPGSHHAGNMNPGPNGNAVSASRINEPNVSSSIITGPSCDMSSGSRTNGTNENGCSAQLMNSLQLAVQSDGNRNAPGSFFSERKIYMCSSQTIKESSSDGAGPSNSRLDENVCSVLSESSTLSAQLYDIKKDVHFSSSSEMESDLSCSKIIGETSNGSADQSTGSL